MSKKLLELVEEIDQCRDIDLPHKLLKLREIVLYNDDPKRVKNEIYKFSLLEALSVSFKHEYGFITNGWSIAVDLVKIFCLCTTDFLPNDKSYQNELIPNALENALVLAKKIQEKHAKSTAFSDEFLSLFQELMKEYSKIVSNHSYTALKSITSQRLFQLLLNDEQVTASIVMNTFSDIFKVKRSILKQIDEKALFYLLDEIIYKMASCELPTAGNSIFNLLNTMCQLDPNLIKSIVRRYKGMKLLLNKWSLKAVGNEINEFTQLWEGADKTKYTDEHLRNQAILIQKVWRGFKIRKDLKEKHAKAAKIQSAFRKKKQNDDDKRLKKMAQDELKFQLLIEHRRRQRQKKMQLCDLIEVLPPNQIEPFLERQREHSATLIQAVWKGYRTRKMLKATKEEAVRIRAAIIIQQGVRRFLERLKNKRQKPAFYSRPTGLDGPRREFLFDKIRQHVEGLPPHPRSEKVAQNLHDKAQREFQNYVLTQHKIREQQQNTQVLLALANNDADLILNAPKLSEVTEDDINNFFTHKSKAVILAAKKEHKNMLRKHRAKWYELLLDESDSDGELNYDENNEDLENNLRNLNFNSRTDNYYSSLGLHKTQTRFGKYLGYNTENTLYLNHGIPKRERNQLKTNSLRKTITQMMKINPEQSKIWNDNLNIN